MSEITDPGARILVVEDEPDMRLILGDVLEDEGYRVLLASDGEAGLETALREKPDAILLDVMMPKLDGFAVCAELRRREIDTPVLMLTARGQVDDRVKGLDVGADDYLVKPFEAAELAARVRALLRRTVKSEGAKADRVRFGDVEISLHAKTAKKSGESIALTPKEFAVIEHLAKHPGEVVSREQFLDLVWGYSSFPTTRTVDNQVANLRGKIEPDPKHPKYIQTVHGMGYRLTEAAEIDQ